MYPSVFFYWYLWSCLDVYTPLSSFHAVQQVLAQGSSRVVALIHLSFVLPRCATSAGSKELARGSSNSFVFCPALILSHSWEYFGHLESQPQGAEAWSLITRG